MLKKTFFCLFALLFIFCQTATAAPSAKVAEKQAEARKQAEAGGQEKKRLSRAELRARFRDQVKAGYKKVYVNDKGLDVDILIAKDGSKTIADGAGFFDRYKDCVCFIPLESEDMAQMLCTCFPPEENADETPQGGGDKSAGEGSFWK